MVVLDAMLRGSPPLAPLDDFSEDQSAHNPRLASEAPVAFLRFPVCISLNDDPVQKDVLRIRRMGAVNCPL